MRTAKGKSKLFSRKKYKILKNGINTIINLLYQLCRLFSGQRAGRWINFHFFKTLQKVYNVTSIKTHTCTDTTH